MRIDEKYLSLNKNTIMKKYIIPKIKVAHVFTDTILSGSIGIADKELTREDDILTREEQDTWGIEW